MTTMKSTMTTTAPMWLSLLVIAQVLVLNNGFILNRPFVATRNEKPLWETRNTNDVGDGRANDDKRSAVWDAASSAFVMPENKKEAIPVSGSNNSSSSVVGTKSMETAAAPSKEASGVTASNAKDRVSNATNKELEESAILVPNEPKGSKSVNATKKEEIAVVQSPNAGTPVANTIAEGSSLVENDDAQPPPVNAKHDAMDDTGVLTPKPPVTPPPDSIYERTNVPPLEQERNAPKQGEASAASVGSSGGKETTLGKESSDMRNAETASTPTLKNTDEETDATPKAPDQPALLKENASISPKAEPRNEENDRPKMTSKSAGATIIHSTLNSKYKEEDMSKPPPKTEEPFAVETKESVSSTTESSLDAKATSPNVSNPLKIDTQTTSSKKGSVPGLPTKVEKKDTLPAVDVKSSTISPSRTDIAKDKDESKSIEKEVPVSNVSENVEQNQPAEATSAPAVKEIPTITRTEEIDMPKLDSKPDTKGGTMPKPDTSNAKNGISTESTNDSDAKDGIQALAGLFFGSKVQAEQDDAAVMARIKSRKQAQEDER